MATEAPPFWWEEPDWKVLALSPLSTVYALAAGRGMRRARREKIDAPVLCVGNFT
ncbi:MAG: tetraacyldisaccharide 4'-kinase, partial [Mesorhizobium sp.]